MNQELAINAEYVQILRTYGAPMGRFIRWCMSRNINTPAEARAYLRRIDSEGSIEAVNLSRVMPEGYAIQGSDPTLNGCDAQARNNYHRTRDIALAVTKKQSSVWAAISSVAVLCAHKAERYEAVAAWNLVKVPTLDAKKNKVDCLELLSTAAFEKGSDYTEKGSSTGHGEEMPIEVFESFQELYYGEVAIETFEDLKQALEGDNMAEEIEAYSFVEGHEAIETALDFDREEYLAGKDEETKIEKKAAALTKSKGRAHGEFHALAAMRRSRMDALISDAKACQTVSEVTALWRRVLKAEMRVEKCDNSVKYLTWEQSETVRSACEDAKKEIWAGKRKPMKGKIWAGRKSRMKLRTTGTVFSTTPMVGVLDWRPEGFIGPMKQLR